MGLNFKFIVIWKAFSTMSSGSSSSVPIRTGALRPFGSAGSKDASSATPPAASAAASLPAPKAAPPAAHPAAPKAAKVCAVFNKNKTPCGRGQNCWDEKCREASKATAAASPKSSRKGGDGGVAAQLAAMEKRLNERLDTIETKVESGFASQQAAEERLQRAIEAMMGGIGGLARTIEGGIVSSRSTTALPAPETHGSARRAFPALPALPAPESELLSALTNFVKVVQHLKQCPIIDAMKKTIPIFVRLYPSIDQDALACLLLAMLSGKKKSDLMKMGEFTRTKVLPLLTQTNLAIFKRFFEELALKCRSDSCVKVNNSRGEEYKQTFHLLGKEESDICYLIQILLEEA